MGVGTPLVEVWLTLPTSGLVEITQWVRLESGITITAGRADEKSQASPSSCRLVVDNRDGRFSPYNVSGAWYGQIKRGLTLTVKALKNAPADPDRFIGDITELPIRWDQSANDRYVTIVAAGVSRRLNGGASRSPLTHDLLAMGPSGVGYPFAYWTLEGGSTATALGSAVGGTPMALRGTVTPGNYTGYAGSDSILTLGANGGLDGSVGYYTPTSSRHVFRMLGVLPVAGFAANRQVAVLHATGTVKKWVLEYQTGTHVYKLLGYNAAGTAVVSSGTFGFGGLIGLRQLFGIELTQNGTAVDWRGFQSLHGTFYEATGSLAASTVGKVKSVSIAPNGDMSGTVVGHAHFSSDINTSTLWQSVDVDFRQGGTSHPMFKEKADLRIKRLLTGAGVSYTVPQVSAADAGEAMSWPTTGTLWARLVDCAKTDGGLLADSVVNGGLEFYSQRYLYGTSVALTLDVASGHVAKAPDVTLDDQGLVTDASVTRRGGTTSRYQVTSSEGVYTSSETLSLYSDPRALPAAEWMVAVGSTTDVRIPKLAIDLAAKPALISAWLLTRFGQRLRLTTPPVDMGPGVKSSYAARGYEYIIQGWREVLGFFDWDVELNLIPAAPWNVGFIGATNSRVLEATAAPTSQGAVRSTTDTFVTVNTATGVPLLSTAAADYPRNIMASTGEEMTATAVSGAANPQTITVIRSVNGVAKTVPVGTTFTLVQPFRLAR